MSYYLNVFIDNHCSLGWRSHWDVRAWP